MSTSLVLGSYIFHDFKNLLDHDIIPLIKILARVLNFIFLDSALISVKLGDCAALIRSLKGLAALVFFFYMPSCNHEYRSQYFCFTKELPEL